MKIAKALLVAGLVGMVGLSAHAKTGDSALLKEAVASLEVNTDFIYESVKIVDGVARIEKPVYTLKMRAPIPSEELLEDMKIESDDVEVIANAAFLFTWSGDWIELTPGDNDTILISFSGAQKVGTGFKGALEELNDEYPYTENDFVAAEMVGSYRVDGGKQTLDVFAKTAVFDLDQTEDGIRVEGKQTYTDLSNRVTYPVGVDLSGSAEEVLETLGSLDFELVFKAAASDMRMTFASLKNEELSGEWRFQSAGMIGEVTYGDRAGKLWSAITDLRMSGAVDTFPLPFDGPVGFTFGEFYQGAEFSLEQSDEPQPVSIEFGMENVVLDQELWALIDPSGSLVPNIQKVRMVGTADFIISANLFDLTQLIGLKAPPFAPQSASIEEFTIEALGASALATGEFDLSGETLTGKAKVVLNNWEALIDDLAASEMIPPTPDVFKGMISQFAKPGDSKNESLIDVDISDDLITVGGTPVGPAPQL